MSSYILTLEPVRSDRNAATGHFQKGAKPWNKGMSWDEMGFSKELQKKIQKNLLRGRGGREDIGGWNMRPVVAVSKSGRFVRFASARSAAKLLNLSPRNIIHVCRKERQHCGGLRWFYENDNEWISLIKQ